MNDEQELQIAFGKAAQLILGADAVLIAAGAGMGVDSGLPAFRGPEGFESAFSEFAAAGFDYRRLSSAAIFEDEPHLAWGFHTQCMRHYRYAKPHEGFEVLRRWVEQRPGCCFVYTSNIDGQFQKAGFDPQAILECHGTASLLQCTVPCSDLTWPADLNLPQLDAANLRALDPLPRCPQCGAIARPNVRFFDDGQWVGHQTHAQSNRYETWKSTLIGRTVVVIECGAGETVPAVRLASDWALLQLGAVLIRINPREADVPSGHVSIRLSSRQALKAIDRIIRQ